LDEAESLSPSSPLYSFPFSDISFPIDNSGVPQGQDVSLSLRSTPNDAESCHEDSTTKTVDSRKNPFAAGYHEEANQGSSTSSDCEAMRAARLTPGVIPHSGALCRLEENYETFYIIAVFAGQVNSQHELIFTRSDLDFAQRLFLILDTENRGFVSRAKVREFTTQRCPVFWRRDEDLRKLSLTKEENTTTSCNDESPTFDEIWNSVAACSQSPVECNARECELGLEGWMVFCRFIALAQYLEAKRRFSARHSQQTMRHRNSPRGSEVVMVNVPPPEPPAALSPEELATHEQKSRAPLPLPELDLDHSLLAAHDSVRRSLVENVNGRVKIDLFGPPQQFGSSHLEFAITFSRPNRLKGGDMDHTVVRRSLADLVWLDDTVKSHKALGGTLCGRILPPFPRPSSLKILSEDSILNSSIKNTGGAIAAAAKGVTKITSVAKSIFGSYLQPKSGSSNGSSSNSSCESKAPTNQRKPKKNLTSNSVPETYFNPNSPDGKARQLERYLNYLLDHPAFSTSFPLNAILTASQSGLEAAKKSVEECNKVATELREHTPHLDDSGKMFIPRWSGAFMGDNAAPDFTWTRTAAQAAMALRVHGMLETTGMPSASARLQHASLPSFGKTKKGNSWDDDSSPDQAQQASPEQQREEDSATVSVEGHGFEEGVIQVQSGLQSQEDIGRADDGYDMLPLPVPAPERRILTVGNADNAAQVQPDSRFHYGNDDGVDFFPFDSHDDESSKSVLLASMSVDDNIDKLREVIGSVDNTLSRCLGSSGGIGAARRERLRIQLDVVHELDSWEGMRGQFISQRSLLRGVGGLSQSRELYGESDLVLVDDMSWQTSLAHSAVGAAEDVRSAIRASRTAANAKAAANSAAMTAENACAAGNFSTMEEARAAQTRSSIAQSHAIHAAVVDHEAKAVKRRATLALAHDVKCWNLHRKSELLKSCLSYAKSQHEGTRRAVDAWSSLRDGFIGTPLVPSTQDRRIAPPAVSPAPPLDVPVVDPDEAVATIYDSSDSDGQQGIVAVEHSLFISPEPQEIGDRPDEQVVAEADEQKEADGEEEEDAAWGNATTGGGPSHPFPSQTNPDFQKSSDYCDPQLMLPFATASPITEEAEEVAVESSDLLNPKEAPGSNQEEALSESMQSLVDGLMSWGLDADEDLGLPAGMAANIALEESR